MKKILSIIVLLLVGLQLANAQTYSPDRPGIGNGSFITPKNMLGLEAGLDFTTDNFINQFSIGQLLLRYGVTEKLELRANLGSYISQDVELTGGDATYSGFTDISIGGKYNFVSGVDQPNVSALAQVSLPVGSDEFTSDEVVPTLAVLADHSLNEIWSISSNLGYNFGVGDLDDSWLFTLTPGFTVPDNESLGGYFGYAGMYYGDGFNQHWLEGGVTYGLKSGTQLDANLGYETEGEIFFIGLGIAKGF